MDILIPGLAPTVVGVVAFAVVFVSLAKVLLPRVNKVLDERKDAIEGQVERAEQLTMEAGEVLAEYARSWLRPDTSRLTCVRRLWSRARD